MSIELIQQLEDTEQFEKAYELSASLSLKNPKSIELLEKKAHLAIIVNKKNEAINAYNKILDIEPNNTLALSQLMDLYFDTDKFLYYTTRGSLHTIEGLLSHAVSDYKKALDKTDNEKDIYATRLIIASLYEDLKKENQAIDEYLRLLDMKPQDIIPYISLAKIYENQDLPSSAVETLERAVSDGFKTENVKDYLAELCLKNDLTEKAREYSNDDFIIIKSFLDEEKNDEAFKKLKEIEPNNKKNPKFYSLMAQYYYNLNEFDNALESIEEFAKFDKNSPLTFQMRALIYEEQNQEFLSHLNWGKYYLKKGDKDVALNEFLQADKMGNNDENLLITTAQLLEQMGNQHQAIEFYERYVNLNSDDKTVLDKVATYKANIGDWFNAMKLSEKIFELDKKNLQNLKRLANVYENLHNKDKSIEFYELYLKHAPIGDETEKIKHKIEMLETGTSSILDMISRIFTK